MNTSKQNNPANTNGWDTVYAVQFPSVNKAIISQKSSPKDFSESTKDHDFGQVSSKGDFGQVSSKGDFGDWQITNGGDGKNLRMTVPIKPSSLNFMKKEHKYEDTVTATIEVNLLWVSDADQASEDKDADKKVDLKVATDKNTVSVIGIDPGKNKMDDVQKSIYRMLLETWLKGHVDAFKHVFAVLELNKKNAKKGFQWLMPTDTLYAVVDVNDDPKKSIFGVLCMTEKRKSPGTHEISPFAIPDKCSSGFLITPERIISNMILPGMALMFKKAKASDFEITNDGLQISNKSDLTCLDQQLKNGDWIRPRVKKGNFTVTINDTYVEMEFTDLYFNYPIPVPFLHGKKWVPDMPGISVHMNYSAKASLKTTSDNKFKMDFKNANASVSVKTETWLTVSEIIAGVALSVAGALAGGFLGASFTAGSKTVTSAAEASIDGLEAAATESAASAATNVTDEALVEAGAETATVIGDTGVNGGKFAGFFARNFGKILGSMIGVGVGAGIASIPEIIKAIANDKGSDKYNLDQFGTEALAPLTWPDAGPVKLKEGELTGAFRMGFLPKDS